MILRFFAFMALVCLAGAAQAAWREARSENFVVYGDVNERQLRDFTTKLEKFDSVLRLLWEVPEGADANPLTVLLLADQAAVRKVPGNGMSWASGFYRSGPGGSYVVAARDTPESDVLLYHEYAHHFMSQYFPVAFPAWYVEGFAEFVSTIEYDKKGQPMVGRVAMHRLPGLATLKPLPLTRILSSGTGDLKKDEVESYYGRSWLLAHYLSLSKPRKGQITTYLKAFKEGQPADQASAVFGDLAVLDKEVTSYFRTGKYPYMTLLVELPRPEAVQIRELRPAEVELAVERLQYVGGVLPEAVDAFAAKAEKVAAQFPDDPFALQLLAVARLEQEDFAGAEKAANAALAVAPGASRALLIKGMSRMRMVSEMDDPKPQDWKEARSWIVKANRADGNDPLAYIEYFKSFQDAGERPPEIALDGLLRAHQISPQDQGLRMNVAVQLANADRFEEAAIVLRPLASFPHGNGFAEVVRKYLAAFEDGKMPAFESVDAGIEGD